MNTETTQQIIDIQKEIESTRQEVLERLSSLPNYKRKAIMRRLDKAEKKFIERWSKLLLTTTYISSIWLHDPKGK